MKMFKRTFALFMSACLFATVFVSCSNEKPSNGKTTAMQTESSLPVSESEKSDVNSFEFIGSEIKMPRDLNNTNLNIDRDFILSMGDEEYCGEIIENDIDFEEEHRTFRFGYLDN